MKDIDKGSLKENVSGGWVAWLQHYFVTAWIPAKSDNNVVQTRKDSQGNYIIGYTGPASASLLVARSKPAPCCTPARRSSPSSKSCPQAWN